MQYILAVGGCLVVLSSILAAMGFRGREQIVGVDLGTTFSVVALKKKDKVTVLPDRQTGKLLVPSVVSFAGPYGTTVVGRGAVELRSSHPHHTIFNSKRFIGRTLKDVKGDAATHPFVVVGNSSGGASGGGVDSDPDDERIAGFSIPGYGSSKERWVSPVDVGAQIVQHLKRSVADYVGYTISRAVICVPAKFGREEAKATQQAFEQGGFKVMRVLDEPTAAAIAYNLHKGTGVRYVMVYDIGGGTLDTSLLYMNGKAISVSGVAGDDHLGGSDFDLRVLGLLEAKLATARVGEPSPFLLNCTHTGLHIISEQAKIDLSNRSSVEVQCLSDDGAARKMTVTRDEFEHASADLFDRAIFPVQKVLEDQVMTPEDVDDVVLVGGASRTPKIRELLRKFFGTGKQLHTDIDPDVTVAYGAANVID